MMEKYISIEKQEGAAPLELLEERSIVTKEELRERFPEKQIYACDFYVEGIENDEIITGGFKDKDIVNIDHHAPVSEMAKVISSTNLTIRYVKENGVVSGPTSQVVINHTDCDSVLSSSILRGVLEADEQFGEAAIAADHTGAENRIADLLQSVSKIRDIEFSLRNLKLLLADEKLEDLAGEMLAKRMSDRARAAAMVEAGAFSNLGDIYFAEVREKIDGEFLPALLPEAKVILLASPMKENPNLWEIKVRLGNSALGIQLNNLELPNFGGRWNAGSTKRSGGTPLSVREYAQLIQQKISGRSGAE